LKEAIAVVVDPEGNIHDIGDDTHLTWALNNLDLDIGDVPSEDDEEYSDFEGNILDEMFQRGYARSRNIGPYRVGDKKFDFGIDSYDTAKRLTPEQIEQIMGMYGVNPQKGRFEYYRGDNDFNGTLSDYISAYSKRNRQSELAKLIDSLGRYD
jgi:hypothetical protein